MRCFPTASLALKNRSRRVQSYFDDDQQPEISIWPPNRNKYMGKYDRYRQNVNGFRPQWNRRKCSNFHNFLNITNTQWVRNLLRLYPVMSYRHALQHTDYRVQFDVLSVCTSHIFTNSTKIYQLHRY